MESRHTEPLPSQRQDKQLQGISFDAVLEKRRLDQALNAKEFAVCAGVSYSTARHWFHLPRFPVFHGVVFWQDFVRWRAEEGGLASASDADHASHALATRSNLPPRAAQILRDA